MDQKSLKVLITGAAGKISQNIIPLICSGQVFGREIQIELSLFELESRKEELEGLVWELEECVFSNLKSIRYGYEMKEQFKGVEVGIFLGGKVRTPGMNREHLININCQIFKEQGQALNEYADPNCKVLVVANPTNTNCLILQKHCPNIPKSNFTCLTRLDLNRTKQEISIKLNCKPQDIHNLIIWGNTGYNIYPDTSFTLVNSTPINSLLDKEFLEVQLLKNIKNRGSVILQKKQSSAVISAAIAIMYHLKDWYIGTNHWINMGVISDGSYYDIPEGICISMPVKCVNFQYQVISDLQLSQNQKQHIQMIVNELISERNSIHETIYQQ